MKRKSYSGVVQKAYHYNLILITTIEKANLSKGKDAKLQA